MADSDPPGGVTIERDAHTQQFVTVHNRVARDKRLKRASRGLLIEILSLPTGTRITFDTLADNGPEGRDALRTMIRELEKYGYVGRKTTRDDKGRYWTRYIFRETPGSKSQDGFTALENPHWTPPAETQETPAQDQRGFSASENPSPKSFKDKELKDEHLKSGPSPEPDPKSVADQMIEMVTGEIRELTGATLAADVAERIGRELLGRREEPPEHPVQWVRALLRAEANPRKFLPTPTPPKFTAPPPVAPAKAESIEAAKAAIAHLKRAPSAAGDPLRDLAQQQLAELRDARKKKTEAA